jgi:hypothetical protein
MQEYDDDDSSSSGINCAEGGRAIGIGKEKEPKSAASSRRRQGRRIHRGEQLEREPRQDEEEGQEPSRPLSSLGLHYNGSGERSDHRERESYISLASLYREMLRVMPGRDSLSIMR